MGFGGSGGGSGSIQTSTDVALSGLANNNVLTYNSVDAKWENKPAQAGGATLDGSGKLPDSQLPAGVILYVKYNGTAWPARPTSRTDIQVRWEAATSTDPDPTGYVAGIDYLERPAA